jgi:plasmid stability protein
MAQAVNARAMADFRIRGMSDNLHRQLRVRAAEEDTTLNDLIIRLLMETLAKQGKK